MVGVISFDILGVVAVPVFPDGFWDNILYAL